MNAREKREAAERVQVAALVIQARLLWIFRAALVVGTLVAWWRAGPGGLIVGLALLWVSQFGRAPEIPEALYRRAEADLKPGPPPPPPYCRHAPRQPRKVRGS